MESDAAGRMSVAGEAHSFAKLSAIYRLSESLTQSMARYKKLVLLLTACVFGLNGVYGALKTPLWFDEFFTFFIAQVSPYREMLKALPADGQPPLHYLIARIFLHLPGPTELVLRLPDLIAYVAAGLLTYRIARKHADAAQALFAAAVVWGAVMTQSQAITARPYTFLLTFTAFAFASWQVASERQQNRLLPLSGVTLGLAGAILSHHFGVIHVGLFLAAGEILRLITRRRFDPGMLIAIGAGLLPLVVTLPLAHQSHAVLGAPVLRDPHFWSKPSWGMLSYYIRTVPLSLLAIVALLTLISLADGKRNRSVRDVASVPVHEWGAAAALCFLYLVVLAVSRAGAGFFWPRYAISTTLGLALVLGWGLPRVPLLRPVADRLLAAAALIFVSVTAIETTVSEFRHPVALTQLAQTALSPLLKNAPSSQPIVVANAYEYLPQWWYSSQAIRSRMTYLSDLSYAERQQDFVAEASVTIDRAYLPMPITDYQAFLARNPRFLLLYSGTPRLIWIASRLKSEGWRLTTIAKSRTDTLYQVDAPLAAATVPRS